MPPWKDRADVCHGARRYRVKGSVSWYSAGTPAPERMEGSRTYILSPCAAAGLGFELACGEVAVHRTGRHARRRDTYADVRCGAAVGAAAAAAGVDHAAAAAAAGPAPVLAPAPVDHSAAAPALSLPHYTKTLHQYTSQSSQGTHQGLGLYCWRPNLGLGTAQCGVGLVRGGFDEDFDAGRGC